MRPREALGRSRSPLPLLVWNLQILKSEGFESAGTMVAPVKSVCVIENALCISNVIVTRASTCIDKDENGLTRVKIKSQVPSPQPQNSKNLDDATTFPGKDINSFFQGHTILSPHLFWADVHRQSTSEHQMPGTNIRERPSPSLPYLWALRGIWRAALQTGQSATWTRSDQAGRYLFL